MNALPRELKSVLVVNFVDTLGFSIVMPFFVFLVTRFGGNAVTFGLVSAVYPACQMVAAPVLGRWSDRFGRKRIMFLCEACTVIAWALLAVALALRPDPLARVESETLGAFTVTLPLVLVFFSRAIDGLTGGNASVANAYVADISPPEERSRNFGYMGVSSNLGFVVGPALAGVLGATPWGESLPVFMTLALTMLAAFLIARYIPESKPCILTAAPGAGSLRKVFGQEHRDCVSMANPAGLGELLARKHIPLLLVIYFLTFLGFNFYYTAFPIHAASALGWSVTGTGAYFAVLSMLMVVVQGPVLARLSKRFTDGRLMVIGSVILGASFYLLVSHQPLAIDVSVVLFAVGNGLMWPSVVALLSKMAGADYQGATQGLASSCGSMASIIGLIAGGLLYEQMGSVVFVLSGACIYAAGLASVRLLGES